MAEGLRLNADFGAVARLSVVGHCMWQRGIGDGAGKCLGLDVQTGKRCDFTRTLNEFGRLAQLGACSQEFDPSAQCEAACKKETEARLDAAEEAQNRVTEMGCELC